MSLGTPTPSLCRPDSPFRRRSLLALPVGWSADRHLGRGAFATVYAGRTTAGTRVAIKVLVSDHEQATRRFDREKRVLRLLPTNRHRVRYHGHGHTVGGRPFVATELVQGVTLSELLGAHRRLSERAAAGLILQLCEGLDGLHRLGLTHGDIKPANVMLSHKGTVKVLDFGLVGDSQGLLRFLQESGMAEGSEFCAELELGMLAGAAEFIAPERFEDAFRTERAGLRSDTPADVFAMGVLLHELVLGRRPWPFRPDADSGTAEHDEQLVRYLDRRTRACGDNLRRPRGVTAGLWACITRALRHDAGRRDGDARAFAARLRRVTGL